MTHCEHAERLVRIEDKIDKLSIIATENKTNGQWIKLQLMAMWSIIGGAFVWTASKFFNVIAPVVILSLFACGCGKAKEEVDSRQDLSTVEKISKDIAKTAKLSKIDRCDWLTFAGLYDAFGRKIDIYSAEVKPGRWERHEKPCYPDESRSSISQEGILGALHALWSRDDDDGINRLNEYGNDHGWIMGDGPTDITQMLHLAPTVSAMAGRASRNSGIGIPVAVKGFRAHVLASYLHLRGRVYRSLSWAEFEMAKKLHKDHPGNPVFAALYHRYDDGDFQDSIDILMNDFPQGTANGKEKYGWQGCPDFIAYIWTVAIMKGK